MNINQLENPTALKTFANVCVDSCQKLLLQIERTKNSILAQYREKLNGYEQVLRLALNEAEAIAWQTEFPQLVFPTLALEKAQAVEIWHERQSSLRRATSGLAFAA
jgi:hypothetical protein